jgi:predicted metal-dependent hydrolase
MDYLKINDNLIKCEFHRSNRAKKLSITIKDQRVRVTVPNHVSMEYAESFLQSRKDWVLKSLEKQRQRAQIERTPTFSSGEKFPYRGRNYPLVLEYTTGSEYYATFKGSRLIAYIPNNLEAGQQSLLVKELLKKWYVKQAEEILPGQVEYYSKQLNLPYKKLKIKDQKSRWGSCSNKGTINLNWRIIMAPNQVSAYVIIHELTHLRHMDHSRDFWLTVESFLPDYRKWKKWLTRNGNILMSYFS